MSTAAVSELEETTMRIGIQGANRSATGREPATQGSIDAEAIARRFEKLRRGAVMEALPADEQTCGAFLAAVLTLTPGRSSGPLYEFVFYDYPTALSAHQAISRAAAMNLRRPTFCGGLVYLQVAEWTLRAAGLRLDADRWTSVSDGSETAAVQTIRGAIAAGCAFMPSGLTFTASTASTLVANALRRVGRDYVSAAASEQMIVPTAAVSVMLQRVGLPGGAARSYDRLRARVRGDLPTLRDADAQIAYDARRRTRRQLLGVDGPPLFEGNKIAALGDLRRFRLTDRQREAAERLITDEELSHGDIAKHLNVSPAVFEMRLRQFQEKVASSGLRRRRRLPRGARKRSAGESSAPAVFASHNAARAAVAAAAEAGRLQGLGDLAKYQLLPELLTAVEFRRDHPELTLAQSGTELGVTKDVFTGRLRRAWKAIEQIPGTSDDGGTTSPVSGPAPPQRRA
ncbi:hypothetical protein OS122_29655 [Mycolicibacterium mucogenicum]|uniref:hypothetical protein n=1 Tax=Mycolicibacterium mucogenicum TaxID=56689 RepID=UPI002269CB94|nr:hypothetical protein [Mycolicibacterium mucogenicum]MCX8565052.1 hypothetical protein [Mycolicibacterium mucogenicum]